MANELAIIATLVLSAAGQPAPDIGKIVQESARVTDADRIADPYYDYYETDSEPDGSRRTYAIHMLFGSPYQEMTAINGKSLPKDRQDEEKRKLKREVSRRKRESPRERARRVAEFQKEQNRDRRFMEEFVRAFDFQLLGDQSLDNRQVYLVQATPRVGYSPTDNASKVLTGMRGRLWIDKETFQWLKVEADVIHAVSIEGFLAKVEPGTHFELEKMPVEDDIWLPKHFSMTSNAEVLSFIHRRRHEDETYFDYHKSSQETASAKAACPIRPSAVGNRER